MSRLTLGDFGDDFEKRLLKRIIGETKVVGGYNSRDTEFGKNFLFLSKTEQFNEQYIKLLVHYVREHYNTYNKIPSFTTLKGIINVNTKTVVKKILLDTLVSVFKYEEEDKEWVENVAIDWVKKQNLFPIYNDIGVLLESTSIIDNSELKRQLETALGVYYVNEDSYKAMGDDTEEMESVVREPIATMLEGLDDALNGGLSAKEVALVLAGTGVGKTTLATHLAHHACLNG